MSNISDLLEKNGCMDMNGTMDRFMNDEDFYMEVLGEAIEDPGFELLGQQLSDQDAKEAFNTAHMLKGIISNCGITPVYDLIVKIVEPLRNGSTEWKQLSKTYDKLMAEQKRFVKVISKLK